MADRDANLGPAEQDQVDRHLAMGGELLKQNRVADARKAFYAALEIEPNNIKALGLLGLACFRMNDFAGALPVYQLLVSLNGRDASFLLNLGLVHLKLGNAAEAIRELRRSRDLDPSQSRAVSYLGLAYARNGEYANAFQAFLQAGQKDLAREMEQYLTEAQSAAIRATVSTPSQPRLPIPAVPLPALADQPAATRPGRRLDTESADAVDAALDRQLAEMPDGGEALAKDGGEALAEEVEEISGDDLVAVDSSDELVLDDSWQDQLVDEGAVPDQAVPDQAVPDQAVPDQAAPDQAAPDQAAPDAAIVGSPFDSGPGMISQAVAQAEPSNAATAGVVRVAVGHEPPQPLSEFATARLIRPEDGEHTFETSAGGVLLVRVRDRIFTRTEGVNVSGGELAYEVASRRVRGSSTSHDFSSDGRQLFIVSGRGHLVASPLGEHFTAVTLDDDILYLREDLVFAFEEQLRWENGHVPGSNATIGMVQFRGHGAVAFRSRQPLLSIKLAPERVLYIDAHVLAGWIGRVIPRAVSPAAGGDKSTLFVECTGEGVILIEDEEDDSARHALGEERAVLAGARRIDSSRAADNS